MPAPVLVISGPEKAGKTTAIGALQSLTGAAIRKWSKINWTHEYLPALIEDINGDTPIIWDRSWACEAIYAKTLSRDSLYGQSWWLSNWELGRALQSAGRGIIVLGPTPEVLGSLRTPDDLPVSPVLERRAYHKYALDFPGTWELCDGRLNLADNPQLFDSAAEFLASRIELPIAPPEYGGPINADIVFVGEGRNPTLGQFALPFTSSYTRRFGEILGSAAFKVGWTNQDECQPEFLSGKTLIACGNMAYAFCSHIENVTVFSLPHPAWMFRWENTSTRAARISTAEFLIELKGYLNDRSEEKRANLLRRYAGRRFREWDR